MKAKIIVTIIALALIFNPVTPALQTIFQPVPTAHAILGLGDIVLDPSLLFQTIWDNVIKPALITTLKKEILDRVVDEIIAYIQGGGKPKFITDWNGFLAEAGQNAVGDFAQGLGAGFLCSPFGLQIRLGLLPVPRFSQQATCTLKQIVGNIQNFYNDFRNGGWIAYGEGWQPQNNYFGALLMTNLEAERRRGIAESASFTESIAYGGFTGTRDKNGNIITPGSTNRDLTSKALGAQIDFVLLAEDYASAIAAALINQVIVKGLAAAQPSGTSQSQVNSDLSAYNNSLVSQAFASDKDAVLGKINTTLSPRLQAQSLINDTIANLMKYKGDLTKISSNLTATGKTTCGTINVSNVQSQIAGEQTWADGEIAALTDASTTNATVTNALQPYVTEINRLPATRASLNRLQEIQSAVTPLLDDTAANDFLASIQQEANDDNQRITDKTNLFNQDLQQCQQ